MHFTKTKIKVAFSERYRTRVRNVIHNLIIEITNYISIKFIIEFTVCLPFCLYPHILKSDLHITYTNSSFPIRIKQPSIPTYSYSKKDYVSSVKLKILCITLFNIINVFSESCSKTNGILIKWISIDPLSLLLCATGNSGSSSS